MPRKKKITFDVESTTAIEGAADPEIVEGLADTATVADSTPPAKDRIAVPLDDNGRIDLGSMREKTIDKLRKALQSTPGLTPQKVDENFNMPEAAISAIYNMIGVLETVVLSRKYDAQLVAAIFTFNDYDLKLLMEPTQAVMRKHLHRLSGWQEETTLLLVLVRVHMMKMAALQVSIARKSSEEQSHEVKQ